MKDLLKRFDLQLFADGGDPDAGDDGGNEPQDPAGDDGDPKETESDDTTPKPEGKTFTQDDLDKIIQKRLARERKQWEQQLEEERKKAAMSEAERLKAEKEEAEKRAQEAISKANELLLKAEVKQVAVELGIVDPDAAYLLMDREDIEVKDGAVAGAKEALEQLLEAKPWLKRAPEKPAVGTGSNPGKSDLEPTPEQIAKMSQAEYEAWRMKTMRG
jgi:alanyl-tRNA synthetase